MQQSGTRQAHTPAPAVPSHRNGVQQRQSARVCECCSRVCYFWVLALRELCVCVCLACVRCSKPDSLGALVQVDKDNNGFLNSEEVPFAKPISRW